MEETKKDNSKPRLRPVVYNTSRIKSGANNTTQQMLLLKALKVTQDPKKLRDMIGVRSVAEVYRTLDKLAIRKEYHSALNRAGITFDFIVRGIKKLANSSRQDKTKLAAFQTILKSVGMDKYEEKDQGSSGSWEDILIKKINEEKEQKKKELDAPKDKNEGVPSDIEIYSVNKPKVPKSERLIEENEDSVSGGGSIYD